MHMPPLEQSLCKPGPPPRQVAIRPRAASGPTAAGAMTVLNVSNPSTPRIEITGRAAQAGEGALIGNRPVRGSIECVAGRALHAQASASQAQWTTGGWSAIRLDERRAYDADPLHGGRWDPR